MNRYFITGGTGFIGQAIVRKLLEREDTEEILLLTRGVRPLPDWYDPYDRVKYWKGDITEVPFPDRKFTHLIHGAADANDLLQPDAHYYYYTIVEGARRIFEWAKRSEIKNVLFVSSGVAAYRDTVYGRAKRQSEFLCEWFHVPCRIARVFSVIGEGMPLNGQYAIGKFIWQAINNGKIECWGGKSLRSYLHVNDCAEWCLAVLDRGVLWKPYEVGGQTPHSISEIAELVGNTLQIPVEKLDQPDERPSNVYLPRSLETQIELGVSETIPLHESILRCYRYYQEHK